MECPCPCHASGSTCSVCASTEGRMKGVGGGMMDPLEIGVMMWHKAFLKANIELMAEKLKKRMEARWGEQLIKQPMLLSRRWKNNGWRCLKRQEQSKNFVRNLQRSIPRDKRSNTTVSGCNKRLKINLAYSKQTNNNMSSSFFLFSFHFLFFLLLRKVTV